MSQPDFPKIFKTTLLRLIHDVEISGAFFPQRVNGRFIWFDCSTQKL